MSKLKYLILHLLIFSLFPQLSFAERVKIGDLYFDLNDNGTASVTYQFFQNPKNYNYLVNVIIPKEIKKNLKTYKVISIGEEAFNGCTSLRSMHIPNSVTSIGSKAFRDCRYLKNIEIPNSIKSIGKEAFYLCFSLDTIEIPNSVISIEDETFCGCRSLKFVTIPNSVISIGNEAFYCCNSLTNIEIPNSVTSIGFKAFYGCSSLNVIEIPNSVTSIGYDAFKDCSSLTKIYLPEHLGKYKRTIGNIEDIILMKGYEDFAELIQDMMSWELFYEKNKKALLTYKDELEIQEQINRELWKWQEKDEFETIDEWKQRVNDETRQQKIKELSTPLLAQHNQEIAQINREQKELAIEYENYKKKLLNSYYNYKIIDLTNEFKLIEFELRPYDAEHGTFLIVNDKYGDILLPVPGRDEARSFKDNWESIKKNIKPEFVPNGEDVALTKLIFTNNGKQYVYDSHTEANYAVTDVKYNFKPVELADISLDDINTNLPALANADVSSQIISKTSNEAITPQKVQPSKNTVVASDRSDVDYAIPTGIGDANSTTYAVIIANENYKTLSKVPYAANDGEIMSKYLTTAVGLPQSHVKVYKNATVGSMAEAVSYMEDLGKAYGEKLNLIFYYAGHGVPDERTKTALLLPVDGNPSISKTCYSVDELVKNLGNLKANNVIVMLDACFSGATRNDDMLVAARGVKLRSNDIIPIGNMVFFSATQGDETAYPYEKEGHGLFTYFLLKKLQDNKGNVTLGELADYVIEKVKQKSMETNGKLQTPTVTVSPNLQSSWREIPLK